MSGILKSIKKVFRKVTKFIKKIALPVLAIGAVVLTGGAAIGALPSLSSMVGSLGLSQGLTTALVSAAKGATMGALGSAVTGGNIAKGASMGFLTGGLLSAAGAPIGGQVNTVKSIGETTAQNVSNLAAQVPNSINTGLAQTAASAAPTAVAASGAPIVAQAASNIVPAVTTNALPSIAGGSSGGGLLSFLNQNPTVAAMGLQGLGAGLTAAEQAKDAKRERKQIAANYQGYSGLINQPDLNGDTRAEYDPTTGQVRIVRSN